MSIAGATEGLEDLVNEYKNSVGDPEVTVDDHHAIANDMMEWVTKFVLMMAICQILLQPLKDKL